jgi:PadR family transcriptional regulator PadR
MMDCSTTVGKNPSGPPERSIRSNRNRTNIFKELSGTWTELSDAVNLITNQNNSHEQNCK